MLLRTDKGMTFLNGKKLRYRIWIDETLNVSLLGSNTWAYLGEIFEINLTTSEFNCLFRKPDMKGTLQLIIV